MSRESSLAKNTGIIALGTFLPRLAAFVTLPILTGLLTKEEYGTYDLVTVMVSLLLPSVTLQIHAAAFRFLVTCRNDEARTRSVVSNVFALAIPVSMATLTILYFSLSAFANAHLRLLVCIYFLVEILIVDLRQVARGIGRSLDYSVSAIVAAAGTAMGAVVFVWVARLGLVGAVASLILANGLSAAYLAVRLKVWRLVSPTAVDIGVLKDMLAYSWPMVPNELSLWVMNLSDRLIVTAFLGIGANAVYAVANKIPHVISMAQSAFTLAWQENASLAADDEDVSDYYSEMLATIYNLQAGFFGLVVASTPVLFPLLIRGDYAEAYAQIPLLCLGVFFSSMSTFMGGIYVARMETRSIAATTVAAALVNVALNALLIRVIGLYAASLSTCLSFAALFAFRMRDVRRLVTIRCDWPKMAIVMGLLLVESALCYVHRMPLDVANAVIAVVAFFRLNSGFVAVVRKRLASWLKGRVG